MSILYARKNQNDNFQELHEHLNNVSILSESFSQVGNITKLTGLLHDIGKATNVFQDYLIYGGMKGSVIHSIQGALFVDRYNCKQCDASILLKEILEMVIASHHNSLKDGVSPDGENYFYDKINKTEEDELNYNEVVTNISILQNNFNEEISCLFEAAVKQIDYFLNKVKQNYKTLSSAKSSANFAVGLFLKYIYSCLIDADRLDAYLFEQNEKYIPIEPDWDKLITTFELQITKCSQENDISKIRAQISQKCKEAAKRESGIYQLSVPTGGGKTFSSLRFALHHAKEKGKQRIIYVIPYLSIIEQTAKSIKEILNLDKDSNIILEHHSNIVTPEDDEKRNMRKLATSRWDNPIIITTMVQFLETVISSKASKLRKFHNMQDSIIIFDEIQSIPVNSIHLFNETVNFLSKILGSTILLCTATQPLIGKTERKNLILSDKPELIDSLECNYSSFKRTEIIIEQDMDLLELTYFLNQKMSDNQNCLIIMNTKKEAKVLYQNIKSGNKNNIYKIYHLSAAMCSAHKCIVLGKIKECLIAKEKVICISTQLIEAGVDISFSCVIRALAGLDSIAQAAGRCNRNGEFITPRKVYVVPIKDENLDKLPDIKAGKDITKRIINENKEKDLLCNNILQKYYQYYFFNRKNLMDFPIKVDGNNTSIYELLSTNTLGRSNYTNRTGEKYNNIIGQAFDSSDENYLAIANNTETVIVYYGEAEKLIDLYKKSFSIKEKIKLIQDLGKYSVSLYRDYEFQSLNNIGAISLLDEEFGIKILDRKYYSDEVGVITDINYSNFIV